jgi:hypothetical protein
MRAICTVIAAAGAIALAAPATPASGAGLPSTSPLAYPHWFSLSAIPPSVTSTCPADHFVAMQLANSTGARSAGWPDADERRR